MNAQAISTATILVRFADPAPAGKKQATIKASDGTVYGVWPKDFGRFQPGGRYRVEYTERPYNGRTYRTIVKAEPEAAPAAPAHQERAAASGEPTSAEAEFVTRCLAAAIMSGGVGRSKEELTDRARLLRAVWRDTFA